MTPRSHHRMRLLRESAFTTIELLVASSLLLVVTGAIAAMALPMRDAVERSLGRADLTGSSRFAVERLLADLREAGSPPTVTPAGARLEAMMPPVVTLQDLQTHLAQSPGRAVQIASVPALAPQGELAAPVTAGTVSLPLNLTSRCTAVGLACGFRPGMTAVLFDASRFAILSVQSVDDVGTVRVAAPVNDGFAAGSVLAALSISVYGLRLNADGSSRLVRVRQGSEQPILDHVVDFAIEQTGPDPFRVRRVQLRLRLEAASAALRGPAGYLFTRGGAATRARQWVPDIEVRTSVALRQGAS
jgi:hypothetical protein